MSNFKRIVKAQVKFWEFQDVISWNLTFIFLGSLKNFSLVLSQITNYYYIFSPWKMKKKECSMLLIILDSGTRFLSSEN